MKLPNTHRLHSIRLRNDAAGSQMEEMRPRFAGITARHENGTAPRAVVAHQLFQTPLDIATQLVGMLGDITDARCLEPSAGLGRLLDALEAQQCGEITAIEIAPQCAGELFKLNRPGLKLLQRDFLTVLPDEIGHFDFIAMNPPFTMRADIRHINHALDFLKPGGRLAAIMMDTEHRARAFRDQAAQWIPLPSGTFKAEGTSVPAIMALFQG